MDSCLFCKIIAGQIPSDKVYEDDRCYAFRDINPQAPVHILIVPKTHVADVAECTEKDSALAGHVLKVASELAKREGLTNGFRLVTNAGADACQSVKHFHVHLLGGRKMSEKMDEFPKQSHKRAEVTKI